MNAHKKQMARLSRRRADFDKTLDGKGGYRRPGSMNAHKAHPKGKR